MLCCICKEKEAKVHLTQIVGDKVQKVDLCEDCGKKKGIDDTAGASLADLLLGLGASGRERALAMGIRLRISRSSSASTLSLDTTSVRPVEQVIRPAFELGRVSHHAP